MEKKANASQALIYWNGKTAHKPTLKWYHHQRSPENPESQQPQSYINFNFQADIFSLLWAQKDFGHYCWLSFFSETQI